MLEINFLFSYNNNNAQQNSKKKFNLKDTCIDWLIIIIIHVWKPQAHTCIIIILM